MQNLPPEALERIAAYFRALSEPTRLMILNVLREREANVSDLAQACECSVANVSRHLTHLAQHGLVERESRGTSAWYRIADASIDPLCDLVCGSIARQIEAETRAQALFAQASGGTSGRRRTAA